MPTRKSPFWIFANEIVRPELKRQGLSHITEQFLQEKATERWDRLSREEKGSWKRKANAQRNSLSVHEKYLRKTPQHSVYSLNGVLTPERFDEVDKSTRIYFDESPSFEAMRKNMREDMFRRTRFQLLGLQNAAIDRLIDRELVLAFVNLYYVHGRMMVPSELSFLKISIRKGIFERENVILPHLGPVPFSKTEEAKRNERKTGLVTHCDSFKYCERSIAKAWSRIKSFTRISAEGSKIFVLSKDWNSVLGSFQFIFDKCRENSFKRVDVHFMTIEDYLISICAAVSKSEISTKLINFIDERMTERWPQIDAFNLTQCSYHAELRDNGSPCAEGCALLPAHKAAFSFFALSKLLVFKDFHYTGNHMPNLQDLRELEWWCAFDSDYHSVEQLGLRSDSSLTNKSMKYEFSASATQGQSHSVNDKNSSVIVTSTPALLSSHSPGPLRETNRQPQTFIPVASSSKASMPYEHTIGCRIEGSSMQCFSDSFVHYKEASKGICPIPLRFLELCRQWISQIADTE